VTEKVATANILVVEDQRAVAGALRMRLRGLGYDVAGIAKDGTEAIEKAGQLRPDLILMDIRLGDGMDGIEAAHRIRAQYDIPVVYVSAYADPALLDRARATEPAGFINKPFTTKDLLTTINLALHRQRQAKKARVPDEEPASEGVITTDRAGLITFVNRHAEDLTRWSRDSLLGQPLAGVLSRVYGLARDISATIIRRALTSGEEQMLARNAEHTSDRLVALTDRRGERFGVALHLTSVVTNVVEPAVVASMQQTLHALRFVFDQLPMGVVVVDNELKLLHCNRQAEGILTKSAVLSFGHGYLSAADEADGLRLQALVAAAGERASREAAPDVTSEVCALEVPGHDKRLVFVATPVPSDTDAMVALLVFESPGYRELSTPVLNQIYGLTRAEAKLVQSLAQGFSLEEAAHHLGIAVNTARTHLKHIFSKTGAKRQSELIHEVETGPAAFPIKLTRRH
jgi:PAS domain S-box-containing protein